MEQPLKCELCAPESVLAENELAYVRPDNHSLSRGHVIAVPKRHVADGGTVFQGTAEPQTSQRVPDGCAVAAGSQDQPAIWLNKETMERFRPQMQKMYYDASKYDTYLEQLGIKYPTVR